MPLSFLAIAGVAATLITAGALPPASRNQIDRGCSVRYVANAGVLLESNGRKLLLDAPIRDGIPPYAVPGDDERRRLERAEPPYDNVSAILVTHWHEDHFSPEAVAAHLTENLRATLVSSKEVASRVRVVAPGLAADRIVGVTPSPGSVADVAVDGMSIHVLRIRHNPARRLPEEHLGFLVRGCQSVLHTGDADPQADNFAMLRSLPRVDVAIVPFWYVLTPANRDFVSATLNPLRVIAMHLPPADAEEVSRKLVDSATLTLLRTPGTVVPLR